MLIFLDRLNFYVIIFPITSKRIAYEKNFEDPQQDQGQARARISSENEVSAGKKSFKTPTPEGKNKTLYLRILPRLIIDLVSAYQRYISRYLPFACRFYPSCSEYTKQAIRKYGLTWGTLIALQRLSRCHPFSYRQGFDPLK